MTVQTKALGVYYRASRFILPPSSTQPECPNTTKVRLDTGAKPPARLYLGLSLAPTSDVLLHLLITDWNNLFVTYLLRWKQMPNCQRDLRKKRRLPMLRKHLKPLSPQRTQRQLSRMRKSKCHQKCPLHHQLQMIRNQCSRKDS